MSKSPNGLATKQLWIMSAAGVAILVLAVLISFLSFYSPPRQAIIRSEKASLPTAIPTVEGAVDLCRSSITGEAMQLQNAQDLAASGVCGREGSLSGTSACNEYTGTWWLDLDIPKEGCSPACVVNVNDGESEINWRCTGIMLEDISLSPAPLPTRSSGCGCGQ